MSADDAYPPDERFAQLLASWDDALAAGEAPAEVSEPAVPAELRPRLERAVAWCRMVRRLLPGPGATPGPAAEGPDLSLKSLGRFQIRRELGRGGYGVVFLAFDPQLGREVALKVPRPEALVHPELRARFQQEARAAAGLDHPNLVPVYDAGEEAGICYIASAYCPGVTLAHWLKEQTGPVPCADAARLVATLAGAVEHAHQRGIVHRDLKPANILLMSGGVVSGESSADTTDHSPLTTHQPKITDFGLAKLLDRPPADGTQYHTQSGAVIGTPSYMAPEQAAGGGKGVGPAADVYALGAILYELLTGRPPFRADTVLETLQLVCSEEALAPGKLRGRLPRDLETICLKCLHKEPQRRYASARALADDLGRFLRREPIHARPVGTPERVWRWARRNPREAAWLAAVVVLVLGGLGVALALWRLAEARRVVAEIAVRQARTERDAAADSARRALAAVRESFTLAAEHPAFQADGLTPARKLLLERARRFLRDFIARRGDDPAVRADVADAHERSAHIAALLGTSAEALAGFAQARAEYDRLARDRPDDPAARAGVARVLAAAAGLHEQAGRHDQAVGLYRDAIARQQRLLDADPANADVRQDLATTWRQLGALRSAAGQPEDALAALETCRRLLRPLLRGRPGLRARSIQAACLTSLGQMYWERRKLTEADRALRDARAVREQMLEEFPSTGARRELAIVLGTLGQVCDERGDQAGTLDFFQRAADLREQIARANPRVHQYQIDLAISLGGLAGQWLRRGRTDQALAFQLRALDCCTRAVAADPRAVEYRRRLGACHWDLHYTYRALRQPDQAAGHLRQAVAAWEEVVARDPGVRAHKALLAAGYTGAAEMARNARRFDEAREAYGKARRLHAELRRADPTNPRHRYRLTLIDANLVYILQETGHLDEALRAELALLRERRELAAAYPQVAEYRTALAKTREDLAALARRYVDQVVAARNGPPAEPARSAARKARELLGTAARAHPDVPALAAEQTRVDAFLKKNGAD